MVSGKLVRQAQEGDSAAQTALYETMYRRIYYLALRLTRREADAEDVTQETFLAAFRALPNLKDANAFEGWLLQIAANQSRKLLRKNSRLADLPEDEDGRTMLDDLPDEDEGLIPAAALEKDSERQIILSLIDSLPEQQRQCVYLFYYAQMSVRQIAETLGCTEGTVKSRLNYARKKLQDAVLATEERDGIRLHSLAPLGLLLLRDCQISMAGLEIPALGGMAGAAAAGSAAGTSAGSAVKTGLLATAKAKVIAGVTAAAVALGGGAAIWASLPPETAAPVPEQAEAGQAEPPSASASDGASTSAPAAQAAMSFTDPAMEANFRVLLGIPEGPIYPEDAAEVVCIYLFDDGMELDRLDDTSPMLKSSPRAGTTAVGDLSDLRQLPLPLTVYDYTSDPALLATLASAENLDTLVMCSETAFASDVSFLQELPGLRQLELAAADGADLAPVGLQTSLERLSIRSAGSISLNLDGLEQLFELQLSGSGALDVQAGQSMPALEILSLGNGLLPELGLLASFPNLQVLELTGSNLRQLDLSQLGLAPSLRCVSLGDFASGSMDQLDLASLAACPSLEVCRYPRAVALHAQEHIMFLEEGAEQRRTEILQEIMVRHTAQW